MEKQRFHPILRAAARQRLFGKSLAAHYMQLNEWMWRSLPPRVRDSYPIRSYGAWLHTLVRYRSTRRQYFGTFFLRNRPLLELMKRLANEKAYSSTLSITVLGCSIGAEVYSILWILRSARPDLKVVLSAVDTSGELLNTGQQGIYTPVTQDLIGLDASIFERLTKAELVGIFDWKGDTAIVKPWLREGITWQVGDASDPELVGVLGPQDMVVANNFLCHMAPCDAERCLRNISQLVAPGGYLFVSGVDLDVRTKVALDLNWEPVSELMAEIHDGDPCVRADWPWQWWGLEPMNRRKRDWRIRYSAAFQVVRRTRNGLGFRV